MFSYLSKKLKHSESQLTHGTVFQDWHSDLFWSLLYVVEHSEVEHC